MKEKNYRPRYGGEKLSARFVAYLLAITIVVGSVPGKAHAKSASLLERREGIQAIDRHKTALKVDARSSASPRDENRRSVEYDRKKNRIKWKSLKYEVRRIDGVWVNGNKLSEARSKRNLPRNTFYYEKGKIYLGSGLKTNDIINLKIKGKNNGFKYDGYRLSSIEDKDLFPLKKPGPKIKVSDPNALTKAEKDEIIRQVKALNPEAETFEFVGGYLVLYYPDNSRWGIQLETILEKDTSNEEAKKALLQAKEDAKAKIDLLDELSDTEKDEAKGKIDQAENKEAIDKILADADALNNKRAEAKKALTQAKENAKAKIDLLDELSDTEKDEAKGKIDQAENKEAIDKILADAEALNNKRAEAKKTLLQAKENAKAKIDLLDELSDTEKDEAKGKIDQAENKEAVDKILADAEALNNKRAEAKKALTQEKENAKAKIDLLDELSDTEKDEAKGKIDQAENKEAINAILTTAEGENAKREEAKKALLQAKEDAKAKIDLLDELSDTEKDEAKGKIDQAENKEAVDKIVKEAEEKNTEGGKNKVDPERLAKAKEALDAYMKSFNKDVVDNPAIEYQPNVKDAIEKAITRAYELLAKQDINQTELEEMEKIPYKKINGKKSGLFRDFTKKALVNYEVLGDKDQENPHNGKKYTALKNNTIKIKSSLKDAGKIGENDKFFFKLNYVKEEDFKSIPKPTGVDATSTPTPKYKKQEVPSADYEVKTVDGGYEIKINKLPEGAKIIKPIIHAKLADNTYFENGTLVFVGQNENPATPGGENPGDNPATPGEKPVTPGGESPDRPSVDNNSYRKYRHSYPIFFGYSGAKEIKPASETKAPVEIKMVTKLLIGSKTLEVTVNDHAREVEMDVEPFISNNRTMLPIRFVAEALGFEVDWDNTNRTVILKDKDTTVKIPVDTNQIIVNGTVFESDVKPILKNNRTMLPIANVARALGLVDGKDIIWNGTTKEVIIKRNILK